MRNCRQSRRYFSFKVFQHNLCNQSNA